MELHPLLPLEQPQFVRAWTLQGVKHSKGILAHVDSNAVVSSWLDVRWVVDHFWYTWETVESEKPSSVAVLDTLKPVRMTPTTIPPRSKALKSFVLPIHTLNGTYTQSMSQLSQGLKIYIFNLSLPLHLHQYGIIAGTCNHLLSLCHGKWRCSYCLVHLL